MDELYDNGQLTYRKENSRGTVSTEMGETDNVYMSKTIKENEPLNMEQMGEKLVCGDEAIQVLTSMFCFSCVYCVIICDGESMKIKYLKKERLGNPHIGEAVNTACLTFLLEILQQQKKKINNRMCAE